MNKIAELVHKPWMDKYFDSVTGYIYSHSDITEEELVDECLGVLSNSELAGDIYEFLNHKVLDISLKTGEPYIRETTVKGETSLNKYISAESEVTISGKYYKIADGCFSCCPNIEKLIIEEGVRVIERFSFAENRDRLKEVILPKSIELLKHSFYKCKNLEKVTFSGKIPLFTKNVFWGTKWYRELGRPFVIFNDTLLEYTANEETVVVPKGVKYIGDCAFCRFSKKGNLIHKHRVKEIVLPKGLKIIHTSAFWGLDELRRINIPEGVEEIQTNAFAKCNKVERLVLPESLQKMGNIDPWNAYGGVKSRIVYQDTPQMLSFQKTNAVETLKR